MFSSIPSWFYALAIAFALIFIGYSEWNSRR